MDVLLFYPERHQQLYNCSFYDVDSIPLSERQHPLYGTLYILLYGLFFTLYSMCLYAMLVSDLKRRTCYKFMILLGCFHLIGLQTGGLFVGMFGVEGAVYCMHPTLMYIEGSMAMASWCGSTTTNLILSLNRCFELYDSDIAELVFSGWRFFLWAGFPILYTVYLILFTPTSFFNSTMMSYFFNPHFGYFNDFGQTYHNAAHSINNTIVCCTESIVYVALILLYQRAKRNACVSPEVEKSFRKDRRLYIQVFLIGIMHFLAGSLYVLMQFIPFNFYTVQIPNTAYFLSQGMPAVIYLLLNRSLRTSLLRKLKWTQTISAIGQSSATQPITHTNTNGKY